MRFTLDEYGKWTQTAANVLIELKSQAKPNNCFILQNQKILLVLARRLHIYNEDLTFDKEIPIHEIHPRVEFFATAKSAIQEEWGRSENFHFWVGFIASYADFAKNENKYVAEYKGKNFPHYGSYIAKVRFDLITQELYFIDKAVLLKDEYVCEVYEYAREQLLVACLKNKNVVQFDLEKRKVREIVAEDQLEDNDYKNWITQIPRLNGFFVCAGKRFINLICLKSGKMQKLIDASSSPYFAQPGALFPEREVDDGSSDIPMVFASQTYQSNGNFNYQLHRIVFKDDIQGCLRDVGYLPQTSLKALVEREIATQSHIIQLEEAKKQNLELEAMRAKYTRLMEEHSLRKSEVAEKAMKELRAVIEAKEQEIEDQTILLCAEQAKGSKLKTANAKLQTQNAELEEEKGVLEDEKRVQKETI